MASNNIGYLNFNEINQIRDQLNIILKISSEIENIRYCLLKSLPHDNNLENNLNEKLSELRSISLTIRYLLSKIKI